MTLSGRGRWPAASNSACRSRRPRRARRPARTGAPTNNGPGLNSRPEALLRVRLATGSLSGKPLIGPQSGRAFRSSLLGPSRRHPAGPGIMVNWSGCKCASVRKANILRHPAAQPAQMPQLTRGRVGVRGARGGRERAARRLGRAWDSDGAGRRRVAGAALGLSCDEGAAPRSVPLTSETGL